VSDAKQVEAQVRSTLDALKYRFSTLDDVTADAAARLISKRHKLIEHAGAIAGMPAAGMRIRIHGDYHLGQTLRTAEGASGVSGGDFVLLDFEGEPARPLSQRRRKQSPLKDVAGMLRSFSYAAFAGLKEFHGKKPGTERDSEASRMENWARAWENCAAAAFLGGYRDVIEQDRGLLPGARESQMLLEAFVLEKALYELLYELNNRPTWILIPIAGILSLCE
jgi:maltose alpha-D-glucosyltransferase/alpha-amylase